MDATELAIDRANANAKRCVLYFRLLAGIGILMLGCGALVGPALSAAQADALLSPEQRRNPELVNLVTHSLGANAQASLAFLAISGLTVSIISFLGLAASQRLSSANGARHQ